MKIFRYQDKNFDLDLFGTYGLEYRTTRSILRVKKNNRYFKIDSNPGRNTINEATGRQPELLENTGHVIRINNNEYDLHLLDLYEIPYKIVGDKLKVARANNEQDKKKWFNIESARALRVLKAYTDGNPRYIYVEGAVGNEYVAPPRVRARQPRARPRQPIQSQRILDFPLLADNYNELTAEHQVQGMSAADLKNKLAPFVADGKKIRVLVNRGDTWEHINRAMNTFTENSPRDDYADLIGLLTRFLHYRLDYLHERPLTLKVVEIPRANQPIQEYKDGTYNCACEPILDHLKDKKDTINNRRAIKRVEALNAKYLATGIDDEGLRQLATTAQINIVALDTSKNVWKEYLTSTRDAKIILYAHNKHFTELTAADVDTINKIKIEDQNVNWLPEYYNFTELNNTYPDGVMIESKGKQVALITMNDIYKCKFNEYEIYPDAFTDGGVGKIKFLKQCPFLFYGLDHKDPFYDIYFDADISGFYCYNAPSAADNLKLDHNHSYKSFKNSPANFRGFPIIDAVFRVNKLASNTPEIMNSEYNGLLYIRYEFTEKSLRSKLYYEGSNWYPIEIVQYYYKTYGVDPHIEAFAYAATTYDADFSTMTNSQFRCFIGKCSSTITTEIWKTTDKFEYLRALYQLQDVIINVQTRELTDCTLYQVEYKTDKKPWQLPAVAAYVKAHQKVLIFEKYNALIDAGIVPVCVKVDGIEIHKDDAEKALSLLIPIKAVERDLPDTDIDEELERALFYGEEIKVPAEPTLLFDIGSAPGQWKIEQVKLSPQTGTSIKYLARMIPTFTADIPFSPDLIIPRLTHYSGAGGNGKTQKLLELKKIYPSLCIMAPTHEAADVIMMRGKADGMDLHVNTYHRVFGIGCYQDIPPGVNKFAIDECSMIPQEHLMLMNSALKKHFGNDQDFGGAQIILLGDFYQLPPVSPLVPLFNTWTDSKDGLYSKFSEIELTKNWRQQHDNEFFTLCSKIRNKLTEQEALEIIDQLNTRCVGVPAYDTIDDMYIAGTNEQINKINSKFKALPVGCKTISQITGYDMDGNKVANGKIGIVMKHTDKEFHVQFEGILSKFKSAGKSKKGKDRFVPAMALTVHKSQGKTLNRHVIINPTRLFERNHLYVALTRATKFTNIYLTDHMTLEQFSRSVYVINHSYVQAPSPLSRMLNRYIHEDPTMTLSFLEQIRITQNNECCYCKVPMTDTYGHDTFITLERIDDNKRHTLNNVKLACSACNSSHRKTTLTIPLSQVYELEDVDEEIDHGELNRLCKLKLN